MAETDTRSTAHAAHSGHAAQAAKADPLAQTKADAAKRQQQQKDALKGRPTPTQDELNQANLGMHPELSDDGSGPDPNEAANTVRHTPAAGSAPYRTRDMART